MDFKKIVWTAAVLTYVYCLGKTNGVCSVVNKYGEHIPDKEIIVPLIGKTVTLIKNNKA